MESHNKECCKGKHEEHICELFRTGQIDMVDELTNDPIVSCLTCGAEANFTECVCNPVPIYGTKNN